MTLKPKTGFGHYIVVKTKNPRALPNLQKAAMAAPVFFAKYDIHANLDQVILPSSKRINPLMQNGFRFFDMSFIGDQEYSDFYFLKNFKRQRIPLASADVYLSHDRLEEHLIGAIVTPTWMVERLNRHFEFQKAFLALPSFARGKLNVRNAWRVFDGKYSVAGLYDKITSELGKKASAIIFSANDARAREASIAELAQNLLSLSVYIAKVHPYKNIGDYHRIDSRAFSSEFDALVERFDFGPELTLETANFEARRIADELLAR